ncbi:hypothetical protein [Acrocarpospora phusangensis]|uniref:hypothetical protein n=1 Tax=Acrocarpospora phusangensis TaxID=1070424 RepID=UPI00194E77A8|nr:hypothetical protein [Acrocarpospora phusangensis]
MGIGLLVLLLSGRGRRRTKDDVVWIGGPYDTEHGVGRSTLELTSVVPKGDPPDVDWPEMAETAEPGRHVGGASAGW